MRQPIHELSYIEYDGATAAQVTKPVIAEAPWALYVDRSELVTFMCSPVGLHHLALGFLRSEGLIGGIEDVWQLKVYLDDDRVYMFFPAAGLDCELTMPGCEEAIGSIDVRLRAPLPARPARRILTSGCGGGVTFDDLAGRQPPLASATQIHVAQVAQLMRALNEQAALYRASRGVHSSALADTEQLLVLAEDVGRHNTLDKIRGACMLAGRPTRDHVLVSSGRISTEMISKARKMEVPIVISRTSPTVASVQLAQQWNMTLIGYVRGRQLRVYCGAERVQGLVPAP